MHTDPKHTPGPWAIARDDRPDMEWNNHIVQADRPHIAICFMTHDGDGKNVHGEANARLIAVAPELYTALENILHRHVEDEFIPSEYWEDAKRVLAQVRGE